MSLAAAAKTILYFTNKARSYGTRFTADISFFYSPLTWTVGGQTTIEALFKNAAKERAIINPGEVVNSDTAGWRSLDELLQDKSGK